MSEVLRYIISNWAIGAGFLCLFAIGYVIRKNGESSDIADLLYEENKRKPPVEESHVCPCDTCAKVYRYWNVGDDRKYICEKTSGYFCRSAAPDYCRNYEKRDSKPDSASTPSATQFITVLEELYPKDRIPVVRCEDCRFGEADSTGSLACRHYLKFGMNVKEEDFCSRGERRNRDEQHL